MVRRTRNCSVKLFAKRKRIKGKGSNKKKALVTEEINKIQSKKGVKFGEFKKQQKELWKKISSNDRRLSELEAKREYIFLKKLKAQKGLTRNTAEFVIGMSLRPAFGAGIGYSFGRLWGADDANLNNWMMAGASLGALNKLVQRSGKVFASGEKNFLDKLISLETPAIKLCNVCNPFFITVYLDFSSK